MAVGSVGITKGISGFSSRGPAKDGRVKPDIVAKGQALFSSVYTGTTWDVARNCAALNVTSYGCAQGTSMATPVVTGTMALFAEQWKKSNGGARPLPQTLKALAIAGAEDLGNPGPDYTYGFGFLNAKNTVDLIVADNGQGKRVKIDNASAGSTFNYSMALSSSQDVRVVLSWFDPEVLPLGSEEVADKTLVNDLDVKIVAPDGSTVLPYVLDRTNPGANATHGVNTVDNTEEVEIKGAPAGTYHVVITGSNIPQGPTQFVLVSNADLTAAPPPCVDATEPNDTVATAYSMPSSIDLKGDICSSTDVDNFTFHSTTSGTVQITIKSADSPLKATLITNGVSGNPVAIAAGTTGGFTVIAPTGTTTYVVRVEANGTLATGAYTINAKYPVASGAKRRAAKP
jgi:hypothetical protein